MEKAEEFRQMHPNDWFGFPKLDLTGIPNAKEIDHVNCCPNCLEEAAYDEYEVNGVVFPQCFNETLFSSDLGTTHNWDEVHICQKCGTAYQLLSGCY